MNNFRGLTKSVGLMLAKNSPTILTGLSVTGLVSTVILAVKATPKALSLIDDERLERADEDENFIYGSTPLPKKDLIKLTWKCYIPTAVTGALTVACIVSGNSIHLRRNAALAGLYSLSEKALKEYKTKVVETIGKNKERDIRDEIAKDRVLNTPIVDSEVILTGKGNVLCLETLSGRYFRSDIEQIKRVLNGLSRELLSDMFVTLNEVYYGLGLSATKMGEMVGWNIDDGLIEADFSAQLGEDGNPCIVLDFTIMPRPQGY